MQDYVRYIVGVTIVALNIAAASALAAGGKTGYVDIEKIFEKYQKTVDLNAKLQEERKEKIAERKSMVEGINKLKDEADLLRDESKRKKDAVVDEKVKSLYQFEEKVKREALQKQSRLQEDILGEIKSVISEIGRRDGYDMVFAFTADDIGYRSEKLDLTDEVVKTLNKKYLETKR
ncbi:MAG: OmpH family outer membrane protein [Candidatus Aureabacteria bacterium]|nr:OmpH family outer membrane protein [Candidatus Auribacterota bacterium]